MNHKISKLIIPCIAAVMCLTGCGHEHTFSNEWKSNSTQHWHPSTCEHNVAGSLGNHVDNDLDGYCDVCNRHVSDGPGPDDPDPDLPEDVKAYYNGYDMTLEGAYLEQELQRLCFETHTSYIEYSQYKDYAAFTSDHISSEADPKTVNSSKLNEYFYTGKTAKGVGTREHVWPCANSANLWVHDDNAGSHYVDGKGYVGGGSDLYHIRPSTDSVNTKRGNSKFLDFDDPEFSNKQWQIFEVGDGGPYKLKVQGLNDKGEYAQKAEVADEYKGDVARILVYVWIHYGYRGQDYGHRDMLGSLDLGNVMAYDTIERVQEKLCEWNEMDPPSETEKLRNNTVQKMQGNRNPLVDYPKLMNKIFAL